MWIEIFKAGSHKDSKGKITSYDVQAIDNIVKVYNSKVNESESFQAPLVKGHPKTNEPAYGWIESLKRNGDILLAKLNNVSNEIIEQVKHGLYKKVSIALYDDNMLRHVGLLGAVPPAVKGLKNVCFNDNLNFNEIINESGNYTNLSSIMYSENDYNILQDKVNLLQKQLNDFIEKERSYKEQILIIQKENRLKEFREFTNSLINNSNGSLITPSQSDILIDIMELAYREDINNQNIEANCCDTISNLEKVKLFASNLKPIFDRSEFAIKNKAQADYSEVNQWGKNVCSDKLILHEKAKSLQYDSPGLSYEEAVIMAIKNDN